MDEPPETSFGALLQSGRQKAGLSVRRAAKAAGISEARWRQLERGYQSSGSAKIPANPKADTVVKAADAVGVDADEALAAAGIDADSEKVRDLAGHADRSDRSRLLVVFDSGMSEGDIWRLTADLMNKEPHFGTRDITIEFLGEHPFTSDAGLGLYTIIDIVRDGQISVGIFAQRLMYSEGTMHTQLLRNDEEYQRWRDHLGARWLEEDWSRARGTDDKFNRVLAALSTLDVDELEQVADFATNLAKMWRLVGSEKGTGNYIRTTIVPGQGVERTFHGGSFDHLDLSEGNESGDMNARSNQEDQAEGR